MCFRTQNKNAPFIRGVVTLSNRTCFSSRWRGFALRRGSRRIHKILQFLAGLEERNLLLRHIHLFPGLWMPPDAAAALPGAKAAKPAISACFALLPRATDA